MAEAQRRFGWFWLGAVMLAATLLLATNIAEARNVPGSASAVQSRIDQAVASSILDTTLGAARDAAQFNACQTFLRDSDPETKALRDPCEWGISLGGGVRYVEGAPNGFTFDFTSGFGSLALAHRLSPTTTVVAALIAEKGSGDLAYNHGTLDNHGIGGLAGAIFRLNDQLDLSVLGGVEWLNYETTRSNGLYSGEYDATRYFIDTRLRGTHEAAAYFVEYGAGLRFVEQDNDGYKEYSKGAPFASVPGSGFTTLTGIADIKLGRRLDGFIPYVQATGYVNFLEDTNFATSFGAVDAGDQSAFGRLGVGADMDFISGKLSFTAGIFADQHGFEGADGGLKFTKAF